MSKLLVTAAGGGASNNLIRGIRQSEYASAEIIGTNIDKFYLAKSLADTNYLVPRADAGRPYVDAIKRIVEEENVDLIIANNDAEVGPISKHRDCFGAQVFLPRYETIELCQDKFTLNDHLSKNGIRVAETYALDSTEEIEQIFAQFPDDDLLWCRMRRGSASKGSLPVKSPDQTRFWIKYWQEMRGVPAEMFLLCEYLPGRDYAFQSLWKEGELVIAKTCERLSYLGGQWTPSGTTSTPRVGRLLNNRAVDEVCIRAVNNIDPEANGLFSIDLKEDREGNPCITEINIGRFFMITPVFNLTGRYNMAELYLRLAFGESITIDDSARLGDIGSEEMFLVRELDTEPSILSKSHIESNYVSMIDSSDPS